MILPLEFLSTATWILSGREIFYYTRGDSTEPAALWAFDLKHGENVWLSRRCDVPLGRGLALSPSMERLSFSSVWIVRRATSWLPTMRL